MNTDPTPASNGDLRLGPFPAGVHTDDLDAAIAEAMPNLFAATNPTLGDVLRRELAATVTALPELVEVRAWILDVCVDNGMPVTGDVTDTRAWLATTRPGLSARVINWLLPPTR